MQKYKIIVNGWECHFRTFGLENSDIQIIKDILKDNDTNNITSVYDQIETILGLSGLELLDISKPHYNLENIRFEVKDSENNVVSEFVGTEMIHHEGFYDDEDNEEVYEIQIEEGFDDIMVVVEEYKGGIFELNISSDTIPTPSDFSFTVGSVLVPDRDLGYDFISKIFFKGEVCIPQHTLENELYGTNVYLLNEDTL